MHSINTKAPIGFTEEEWAAVIRGLETHDATVNDYRKVLNILHLYNNGQYNIKTMTRQDAEDYCNYLNARSEAGNLNYSTNRRYIATLRAIAGRMQDAPDYFPDYKNPFAKLTERAPSRKAQHTEVSFANPADIEKMIEHDYEMNLGDRLVLNLMANLGITATQIEALRLNNFTVNENGLVELTYEQGAFQESTIRDPENSQLIKRGWPLELVRASKINTITWKYIGTFVFNETFSNYLKAYSPRIGVDPNDDRLFFTTSRRMPFAYRVINEMLRDQRLRVDAHAEDLTPSKVTMYGVVRTYLLEKTGKKHHALEDRIKASENPYEIELLQKELNQIDTLYKPLVKTAPEIGEWKDRLPQPLRNQMNSIVQRFESDLLYKAAGIHEEDLDLPFPLFDEAYVY